MIRIIKDGIKPKKYKYIYSYTCQNCTCEFEFEELDCTQVRHEKCIGGEHRGEINCPFCSERLFIDFRVIKHREEEIIEESVDSADKTIKDMDSSYEWPYNPGDNEHCNICAAKNRIGDMCICCPHYPYKITCEGSVED